MPNDSTLAVAAANIINTVYVGAYLRRLQNVQPERTTDHTHPLVYTYICEIVQRPRALCIHTRLGCAAGARAFWRFNGQAGAVGSGNVLVRTGANVQTSFAG